MSKELERAISYQKNAMKEISKDERPVFHLSAPCGWINDPNGFSVFRGEVHLFYQYHPYSSQWGPMHWGHSVTKDLIVWETVDPALAPDEVNDYFGCFSGTAIEDDGKHVLFYTGVANPEENKAPLQNQCAAVGDGRVYEKPFSKPVFAGSQLPEGFSRENFRDPKVWKDERGYWMLAGSVDPKNRAQVVLLHGKSLEEWTFENVFALDEEQDYGIMWECPDFFTLDGRDVLIVGPQCMTSHNPEFHNGNNVFYFVGTLDKETMTYEKGEPHAVDQGFDFYAAQTTQLSDGRRVMTGWMKSWDSEVMAAGHRWQGSMICPRELFFVGDELWQRPVRELDNYRKNKVILQKEIDGTVEMKDLSGRVTDLSIHISGKECSRFTVDFACGGLNHCSLTWNRETQELVLDRENAGLTHDVPCARRIPLKGDGESLDLRILQDKWSAEIFINGGRQAATMLLPTPLWADAVRFSTDKTVKVQVEKYDIATENA